MRQQIIPVVCTGNGDGNGNGTRLCCCCCCACLECPASLEYTSRSGQRPRAARAACGVRQGTAESHALRDGGETGGVTHTLSMISPSPPSLPFTLYPLPDLLLYGTLVPHLLLRLYLDIIFFFASHRQSVLFATAAPHHHIGSSAPAPVLFCLRRSIRPYGHAYIFCICPCGTGVP